MQLPDRASKRLLPLYSITIIMTITIMTMTIMIITIMIITIMIIVIILIIIRYSVCDFLTELRRDCLPLYSMCLRGRHLQAVEQMWVRQEVGYFEYLSRIFPDFYRCSFKSATQRVP